MDNNTAFIVTVAGVVVIVWSWPVLVEVRALLLAKIRAVRERVEAAAGSNTLEISGRGRATERKAG